MMKLKKKRIHFQSIFKADLWNTVHNIPHMQSLEFPSFENHFNSCNVCVDFRSQKSEVFYFISRLSGTFHPVFEDV